MRARAEAPLTAASFGCIKLAKMSFSRHNSDLPHKEPTDWKALAWIMGILAALSSFFWLRAQPIIDTTRSRVTDILRRRK